MGPQAHPMFQQIGPHGFHINLHLIMLNAVHIGNPSRLIGVIGAYMVSEP